MEFIPGQHIHFVGIGGIGLSAIARILLERGYKISGSDRSLNALTEALANDGATIYQGHDAAHITNPDMVIISSAITHNPEVIAAQQAGIPVYKRRDILSALLADRKVIAVAGSAGKTTTTALVTHILRECGKDPGYIVGGVMANTGTNASNGSSKIFVIEADEYDNMFHGLRPNIALITNVDYDHPDFFKTEAEMFDSYQHFVELIDPKDGVLLVCADNPGARRLQHPHKHTYGLSQDAHYRAENIRPEPDGTIFDVVWSAWTDDTGTPTKYYSLGTIRSPLAGTHNVQNVLGAVIIAARFCNLPFEEIAKAVATFKSTGRRFEVLGEVGGVIVMDDYAHHPSKIRATLQAARERYPDLTIWAVWQPHTYSRTRTLIKDFGESFHHADQVIVTEIYAAREAPLEGVDGQWTAQQLQHPHVNFCATIEAAIALLLAHVKPPALIVVMSAGDASQVGYQYLASRRN